MNIELQAMFGSVVILFVILMVQGGLVPIMHGLKWGLGPRDEQREPSKLQGRTNRILANHLESMALFVPLVVIAQLTVLSTPLTQWGAMIYVAGRAAFTLIYFMGIPVLRSVAWGFGVVGIVLMAVAVLQPAL